MNINKATSLIQQNPFNIKKCREFIHELVTKNTNDKDWISNVTIRNMTQRLNEQQFLMGREAIIMDLLMSIENNKPKHHAVVANKKCWLKEACMTTSTTQIIYVVQIAFKYQRKQTHEHPAKSR